MEWRSRVPLALTAALCAACATEASRSSNQETATAGASATAAPERDLTLQARTAPEVEVASAVELSRPAPRARQEARPQASPRPAPVATSDPTPEATPTAEAAAVVAAMSMVEVPAAPAPVEDAADAGGRELAPGKTVTVIPASSGPSAAPEEPGWEPERSRGTIMMGHPGDRCRPRGGVRGIGIAGRIPVGIPGRRLR
jgi:hypothetical protein